MENKNEKRCRDYVGVTCANGSCPIALSEKYAEYGVPVVSDCDECFYYEGCRDCALSGTEYCSEKIEGKQEQ